jgi:anti-sigma regulatory factor (Ser/Thr protein kinase)
MTRAVSLNESCPAVAASVPRARSALIGLAIAGQANPDMLDAIRLATSEALTNVVVHAYDGASA